MSNYQMDDESLLDDAELDAAVGGLGGPVGEALGQMADGVLGAVGRTVVQVLIGLKEAERNLC
jgi:hypothetical protein